MDIEKINELWAEDCSIDRNKLTEETLRTPALHQKYLHLLLQAKNRLLKYENEYSAMKMAKYRYLRGEMTKEELEEIGWKQYQGLKPLKSDMEFVLEHDTELNKIDLKIKYIKNVIYQLESILTNIKGRDWAIRNHVEWMKFQAGN